MKLLIVDDHPTNLRLLQAQLESEGHAVLQARNGVEALQVMRREPVDGVVSDILMPDMDGFQLCLEVRGRETLRDLPFVLYTGTYRAAADRDLARTVGADAYLLKPAPVRQIMDALQQARHRPAGALRMPARPPADEHHVLRQYSEVLVRKLEEKNQELLQANQQLEQRVASRTAELLASLKELELFSSAVSHDLRNPLHGIAGLIQIVLEMDYASRESSEGGRLLQRVVDQVAHMNDLITALLGLTQAAQGELQSVPVDLSALAAEAVEALRAAQPARAVEVHIEPGAVCHGDPRLLRAVLGNLLGNAWKYTGPARPARIEFGRQARSDGTTVYYVRDNGVGFDMKQAGHLFEAFRRLHQPADFSGNGIGLATVKRIVQRHGGQVWADSAPGAGATFFFVLEPEPGAAAQARP
jgi:two-component system sensor histidine kinase/response regulator